MITAITALAIPYAPYLSHLPRELIDNLLRSIDGGLPTTAACAWDVWSRIVARPAT